MKIKGVPPIRVDFLPFQLSLISDKINELSDPLHQREFGISVRALRVLRLIHAEPGINLGSLLPISALEKTTLSKLVSLLVKRGLISRQIDADDARYINLHLTDIGVDVVVRADKFSSDWVSRFLSIFSEDEIRMFDLYLSRLHSHAFTTFLPDEER